MSLVCLRLYLLLLGSVFSAMVNAQVELESAQHSNQGPVLIAKFSEQIAPGDYEALLRGLRQHPGQFKRKIALLDSIGGSTAEAMRIGRLLRETGFETWVTRNAVCQGSCIYLLAAGVKRQINGHVGLHRPHFAAGESAQAHLAGQPRGSAQYLRQMGVALSLLGDMQSIAPYQMRLLTPSDLARYRLN